MLSGFSLFKSTEQENTEAVQASSDPAMAAAFWPWPLESKAPRIWLKDDWTKIEQTRYQFVKTHEPWLDEHLKLDTGNDAIARRYVETAKARGNVVRLYKAPVNQAIADLFKKDDDVAGYYVITRFDLDPALIEFTAEGRLVSVLVRVVRMGKNHAWYDHVLFSRVYYGVNKTYIENRLSNKLLENYLIGTL